MQTHPCEAGDWELGENPGGMRVHVAVRGRASLGTETRSLRHQVCGKPGTS